MIESPFGGGELLHAAEGHFTAGYHRRRRRKLGEEIAAYLRRHQ